MFKAKLLAALVLQRDRGLWRCLEGLLRSYWIVLQVFWLVLLGRGIAFAESVTWFGRAWAELRGPWVAPEAAATHENRDLGAGAARARPGRWRSP